MSSKTFNQLIKYFSPQSDAHFDLTYRMRTSAKRVKKLIDCARVGWGWGGGLCLNARTEPQIIISFINAAIMTENFCLSERPALRIYKPVRKCQLPRNSPPADSRTRERRNTNGKRKGKHTQPRGDFISLPVIAWLNNSGQGITSARLDGSEQQSRAVGEMRSSDKRERKGER